MQDLDVAGGKYCVLKFNPWEYDYYNEPLLSLILSLKNQVKAETSFFNINDDHIKMFKDSMKILAEDLVEPALDCIGIATANPSVSFFGKLFYKKTKLIKNELDKKNDEDKSQKRHLNPYIDLEEVMIKVTEGLNKISKDKTVILQGVSDSIATVEKATRLAAEILPDYKIQSAISVIHDFKAY